MNKKALIISIICGLVFCVLNCERTEDNKQAKTPENIETAKDVKQAEAPENIETAEAVDANKPGAGYVKPEEAALKAIIGDYDCRNLKSLPDEVRWPCAQLWYWYGGGMFDVYEVIEKALLDEKYRPAYKTIKHQSWNIDVKNARLSYTPPEEQDPKFVKLFGIDENYHVWVDYSVMFEDCTPNPKVHCISDTTAQVRINLKTGKILPLDENYLIFGGFKPRKK